MSRGEKCEHGLLSQCYHGCNSCEHKKWKRYCGLCAPETAYLRFLIKAKDREISCSLSYEAWLFLIKQPCAYCGSVTEAGIDRVDSELGYSLENSVPCCDLCNYMKRDYPEEMFLSHVKKIYEFQER